MNRDPGSAHQDELPWNDVPADSDVVPGSEEPAPAEVIGDGGRERDLAAPPSRDAYHRDSLDERLAEEEPEHGAGRTAEPGAGELQDPERGGEDVLRGEPDDGEELPAEEDAVRIRDDSQL